MSPRLRDSLLLVALVLLAGSGWLAFTAFGTPLQSSRTVTDLAAEVETTFTHRVLPLPSALYPEPTPLENEPFFYMRLLDRLTLEVDSVLTVRPAGEVEGRAEILVRVVAPERWEREFVLRESQPFRSTGPTDRLVLFDHEFPVDLAAYQDFIAVVEEETRVMPRGDYQIVVVPTVELQVRGTAADAGADGAGAGSQDGTGGGPEITERFEFPYTFELAGNTLMPQGQLTQSRSAVATRMVTEPGSVAILGLTAGVAAARILGLAASAVSAALALAMLSLGQKEARSRPEAERIRRRYRARLLTVRSEDGAMVTGNVLALASFQDLLRVADQLEQSILMVPGEDLCRFIVVGERVTYVYEAAAGTPHTAEAAD